MGYSNLRLYNVALKKPAAQSSTGWDGDPQHAVDGNINGNHKRHNTCSHTGRQEGKLRWWSVDLQHLYRVYQINVYNRTDDSCETRLHGARVYVSGGLVGFVDITDPGVVRYSFESGGMLGREVRVELDTGKHLHMAQVEVMSDGLEQEKMMPSLSQPPSPADYVNVAVYKTCTQSSVGWGGDPNNAVDGNVNGNYHAKFGSHTGKQEEVLRWWQVDLQHLYRVYQIHIYTRTDLHEKRIDKARIYLTKSLSGFVDVADCVGVLRVEDTSVGRYTFELACGGKLGRCVRVELDTGQHLHMAQVEVISDGIERR